MLAHTAPAAANQVHAVALMAAGRAYHAYASRPQPVLDLRAQFADNSASIMLSRLQQLRWDSAFWRRLARRGAAHGPLWLQRWSPTPIGLAFAAWPTPKRHTLRRHLQDILGPRPLTAELSDIARTYASFAHSLADSLAASEETSLVRVDAQGVECLHSALARGRGVVLGTAHTAGWEVALAGLHEHFDAPIAVVMRPERDANARRLHATLSESSRLTVVEVGDDPLAALPLVAHLRKGGIVAVQMDRCPPGVRCVVGRGDNVPWRLPAGPLVLAAASGAPLALVLSSRQAYRHYTVTVYEPISLPKGADEDSIGAAADQVALQLVQFVRAHPSHWYGFDD